MSKSDRFHNFLVFTAGAVVVSILISTLQIFGTKSYLNSLVLTDVHFTFASRIQPLYRTEGKKISKMYFPYLFLLFNLCQVVDPNLTGNKYACM